MPSLEGGRGEAVLETPGTYRVGAEPLIPECTGTAFTLLQEKSWHLGFPAFSTVTISVRLLSVASFRQSSKLSIYRLRRCLPTHGGFRLCLVFLVSTGFPAFTSRDRRLSLPWRNRRCLGIEDEALLSGVIAVTALA